MGRRLIVWTKTKSLAEVLSQTKRMTPAEVEKFMKNTCQGVEFIQTVIWWIFKSLTLQILLRVEQLIK